MTLVFSQNLPGPQTHAIIIGVNNYPHLVGGTASLAPNSMGLRQLTSPVLSARRFTSWLENDYHNPAAQLGSIELLLSPDDHQSTVSVESATFQNIKDAFARWHHDCDKEKKNIALFYFCGHGLDVHITVLLPEDFGQDPLNQWDNAIDLTLTFNNLADLTAQTQCFLLDACREQPTTAMAAGGHIGARALKSTTPTHFPTRNAPILKAAPIGKKANSVPHQVSYFTQSIIDCLDRVGAQRFGTSDWIVTTSSLKTALMERMARITPPPSIPSPLRCDVAGGACAFDTDLHNIQSGAEVMSRISCDPHSALGFAELYVDDLNGNVSTRPPRAAPWELELSAGLKCDVGANLMGNAPYAQATTLASHLVFPPLFEKEVAIT